MAGFRVYGRLPVWQHPLGGIVLDLGDMFGAETRRVLVKMPVPGMAALGLHQVGQVELSYVALPDLTENTISVPVMVNVVPADVAAGRVPNPTVHVEQLILEAQDAKVQASQSLRSGDDAAAKTTLREASKTLRDAVGAVDDDSLRSQLEAEAQDLDELARTSESMGSTYAAKKGMFGSTRRSRGKGRFGGSV